MKTYRVIIPIHAQIEVILDANIETKDDLIYLLQEYTTLNQLEATVDLTNASVEVYAHPGLLFDVDDITALDYVDKIQIFDNDTAEQLFDD